ncbi:hypothetical protein [Butyricicoccus sp.]|uniref:hypothetical protein n=1 Tax=Butyricicoccus sp. TaxID=2049021 RepID=UPI003F178FAA
MMFRGITFNGEKHTYDDWGLVLSKNPIPPQPSVKTSLLEVPGGNGFVNLSAALTGDVTYSCREEAFSFTCVAPPEQWAEIYSEISNYLHGQEMQIVLDDDPDVYYTGLFELDEFESDKRIGEIVIKYTLNPFRLARRETVVAVDVKSAKEQYLSYGGPASPYDVSQQSWNTDLRFGTRNNPTADFSLFQKVDWAWDSEAVHVPKQTAQFVDGDGNYLSRTVYFDKFDSSARFLISDFTDAGMDATTIWRALLSGIGSAELIATTKPCVLVTADSGRRPVVPVIACPVDGIQVSVDGKKAVTLSEGLNKLDNIVIRGKTNLCFYIPDAATGQITVTYRKGWL